MSFDLDFAIVAGFLLLNLGVGLYYSRNIVDLKDYALGGRNFSSGTLAATIAATWIGGGVFGQTIAETYKHGLYFMIPALGDSLVLLVVGVFLVPKMQTFLGNLSIAETMGKLYGNAARLITTSICLLCCVGVIAAQFKVSSTLLSIFFGISSFYAVLLAAIIVIIYSSLGGIRAVSFTDVTQIFTFGIIVPILSLIIWQTLDNPNDVFAVISKNQNFNFNQVFTLHNPRLLDVFLLFLFFIIPTLEPTTFQRLIMARDIHQAKKSVILASFICLSISLIIMWVAMLLFYENPNLDPETLMPYIINHYSYTGLKGLIAIGILSIIMSTADSYMNSAAILLTNDFLKPIGYILSKRQELLISKISCIGIGVMAFFLAFETNSLLELTYLVWGSYMPIITVPLILAIMGFRFASRSILIGMLAGFITIVVFEIMSIEIKSVIPAMLVNLLFSTVSHYFFGKSERYTFRKKKTDENEFNQLKKSKLINFFDLVQRIPKFNLIEFCNNGLPSSNIIYGYFSFTLFLTMITTMSISKNLYSYFGIINAFQSLVLIIATSFLCIDLWPKTLKDKYIGIIWYFSVFIGLIFISSFLVLMSKFSHVSLIILTIHLSIVPLLMGWRTSLIMIVIGVGLSFSLYESYIGEMIPGELYDLKLKLVYVLLIVGSFAITLLKSKQEDFETIEKKAEHFEKETGYLKKEIEYSKREFENLSQGLKTLETQFEGKQGILKEKEMYLKDQLKIRNIEISKLKDVKDEFIRNVMHESNTPLTGILSLCDILYSYYDKLDKKNIKQSIKDIVNSGDRLKTYVNNIADLSKLSSLSYELKKEKVNLSKLTQDRTVLYKKVFSDDAKKQEFKFEIEKDIITECDEYYITQAIDNLISNAVKYGEGNPITINLIKNKDNEVQFKIIDSGVGIPENELISIFDKFTVSTKTKSSAEGRGIGLALCEKIIKVHNGRIWAKQNPDKGVCFAFTLPVASR